MIMGHNGEQLPSTMKAVRYHVNGPPEVLRVEDVPVPQPGPNEVVIKVAYAGVNVVDSHIRGTGMPQLKVPLPATPGKDASGTVAEVGSEVKHFKIGDRVFVIMHELRSSGAYAEYFKAFEPEVHYLPDHYTFQEGASIGTACYTALKAMYIAGEAKPGQSILIHGASGQVGLACVQFAVAEGMNVFGTASTKEGTERVLQSGAHFCFDHSKENYVQQVRDNIGPKGFDLIIEMVASTNLQSDLELIGRPRKRIVLVGSKPTSIAINCLTLMMKAAIITGVRVSETTPEEWRTMKKLLEKGVNEGYVRPFVGPEYPLDHAVKVHHELLLMTGSHGKTLVRP
ncbi:hypothetical protein RvY_16575 [Ramazzottius varieornatus]|uniref:Enoyl reductase (ER) domain-containing protein n=1 Tax=Ramazzottius varieornatus TaxID=947166 RepID=A0A1D1W087_RAMVA|nr:hypothetical protein RvY_16575 [Ramazzottius varieornatus]